MSSESPSRPYDSDLPLSLAALAIVAAVLACMPVLTPDYWLDLVLGRLVMTHEALPTNNHFVYTLPFSTPFFDQPWLGQTWLYALHSAGGLVAAALVRNLCALVALGLVGWTSYRLSDRHGAGTTALLAGFGVLFALTGLATGPEMFTWPLLGALVLACTASRGVAIPIVAAGTCALWANLGPAFWLGPLMVGGFAAAAHLRGDASRRNWAALGVATGAIGVCVTPFGVGLWSHAFDHTPTTAQLLLIAPVALAPLLRQRKTLGREMRLWMRVAVCGVLCISSLAVQPWSDAHRALPAAVWGDQVRQTDPLRGFGDARIPVEAVELLRTWGAQPRVYADAAVSGYILYELQDPHRPAAIVWTIPQYAARTRQAGEAIRSDPEVLRGLFQQYNVRAAIVIAGDTKLTTLITTAAHLEKIGDWPTGTLYVRGRKKSEAAAK